MVTVVTESGEWTAPDADGSGEALWLSDREAETATGWVYAALRQIAGKDANGAGESSGAKRAAFLERTKARR